MNKQLERQINQWQDTIRQGNRCFTLCHYDESIRLYTQARQLAESLFSHWGDTEAAIATVVISYHNLADLYRHTRLPAQALEALHQAHSFTLHALQQARLMPDNTDNENILLQAANRTYFAIMQHQQRYPSAVDDTLIAIPASPDTGHAVTLQ